MTVRTTENSTTVATEVPKGWWKRRRRQLGPPPVVIEVRIDVNRSDPEAAHPVRDLAVAAPVAQAIEDAVTSGADPEAHGLPGIVAQIGGAVRDRIDGILGSAGNLVGHRIDELIETANAQVDKLVEKTVEQAMDTAIHKVVEERISKMLGVTIDLTQLEHQQDPTPQTTSDTST